MERAPEIFLRSSSCLSIACWELAKTLSLFFAKHHIQELLCSVTHWEWPPNLFLKCFVSAVSSFPLKQHSNVESVNDSQMQITCLQHKEEHFVCPQNKERKITILMIFVYSWCNRQQGQQLLASLARIMSSRAASRWPEAPKDRYCGSITLSQKLQANCYWSAPFSADGLLGSHCEAENTVAV